MMRRMYNFLRYTLVLALAPTLVLAQDKKQEPCPDVTINLSGLSVFSELKLDKLVSSLEGLESLSELKVLASLGSMETLEQLEDIQEMAMVYQTGDAAAYDVEKRKVIDKTFKVNSKDILNIENEWGKVHVNTWEKNEIRVKVDIIARAGNEAKAQEILDNIKVLENREGNTFSFRTKREPMRINGNNNKGVEINYTIYMPTENAVAIKNSFGDIYLASMKGKVDIDLKYGSLKCDRLTNTGNTLKIAYSSGSCTYISGGNMQVAFSNMKIDGANNLQGTSKYSDFKIGNLEEVIDLEVKYGSFKIDNISKNIRKVSLDSGFTPVNLNFEDNSAFNFAVNVQFANFNVDKSLVTITSLEKDYTSAEYKGKFGGASPKGTVNIVSKYGDVKFTR
ncbi:hypothetical protein [Pontibacter rugosus]